MVYLLIPYSQGIPNGQDNPKIRDFVFFSFLKFLLLYEADCLSHIPAALIKFQTNTTRMNFFFFPLLAKETLEHPIVSDIVNSIEKQSSIEILIARRVEM